jgi:hypothetical protein
MDEEVLSRLGQVRYHVATNQWSLIALDGSIKTLGSSKMRMRIQRILKELPGRPFLIHTEARRQAVALMNEMKASQLPRKAAP